MSTMSYHLCPVAAFRSAARVCLFVVHQYCLLMHATGTDEVIRIGQRKDPKASVISYAFFN
jgi:hypothetical protein